MAMTKEELETRMRSAAGIPSNPEIQAAIAQGTLQQEQPATPPGVVPATPEEQGLDPNAAAVDFFGGLAADMDAETQSGPLAPVPQQPQRPVTPVEELPYEPPVHQRQPGEPPESLTPQVTPEAPPLEAAIERPLAEEDLRLTAEQWAAAQQQMQPPQQPQQPQQPPPDPAQLEAQAIEQLSTTEYAMSEEDRNALISEPDTVLPKLAARMHVRMQVQMAQQLAHILPHMINQQIQQATKVQSLESSFFGQYPALNKPEYRDTVAQSLTMVRQFNPQATKDEVMRDGAALAAVRLRVQLDGAQQQSPPPQLPLQGPERVARQQPFTPVQGGGSEPVVPIDPNQNNIFATLANDDDW
jgi:hypothetical protein